MLSPTTGTVFSAKTSSGTRLIIPIFDLAISFSLSLTLLLVVPLSTPDYITPDNQNIFNGFDCDTVMYFK